MKKLLFFCALLLAAPGLNADDVYVVPPGTHAVDPGWDFTSWDTAATNIQDAIDAGHVVDGDTVFITNGLYLLPDQIIVEKGVILRSYMDGQTAPEETIIDGNNFEGKPVTNRVMTLEHAGAVLDGLTLQGGQTSGHYAGLYIVESQMVTNCVVRDNIAGDRGGGMGIVGPFGVITHSRIVSNRSVSFGGGMRIAGSPQGVIEYCEIAWNTSTSSTSNVGGGGIGGGSWGTNMVLRWCHIHNNTAQASGGGINLVTSGLIENCLIVSNRQVSGSTLREGGGVYLRSGGTLRNCIVSHNTNSIYSSAVFLYGSGGSVENCTIVHNAVRGIRTHSDQGGVFVNTIIYSNAHDNVTFAGAEGIFFTNCNYVFDLNEHGSGNITNYPMFVNPDAGDFRLREESPCVNAGVYLDWMDDAVDLDGNTRIDRLYGQVDIGAYEYIPTGTILQFY